MGICSLGTPRRLDILVTDEKEYPYALLYFTGSQQFNIAMRNHALAQGYSLNEHGLTPFIAKPAPPPCTAERDIFIFLGLNYVEPRHRVDGKQIHLL
jgi:DNA polymerase (family 10)